MDFILLLTSVLIVYGNLVLGQNARTWTRYRILDGFLSNNGTLRAARSSVHCGIYCSRSDMCQSYFYISGDVTNNCQLQDAVYANTTGMVQTPNVTYYIPVNYSLPSPYQCHSNDGLYHSAVLSDGTIFKYKFYQLVTDFAAALSTCSADGAQLVKITAAKLDLLRNILICPLFVPSTVYYVDGVYDVTNTTWYNQDGGPSNFPNPFWASYEPTRPDNNECTGIAETYSWLARTVACRFNEPFICERI